MRTFAVILISFAIASGVAWVGVQANNTPEPTGPTAVAAAVIPVAPKEAYLFSNRTIESGVPISEDILIPVEIETEQAGKDLIVDTPENRAVLIKASANRIIPGGTPFVKADLVPAKETPVKVVTDPIVVAPTQVGPADSLRPGMRAIALPVSGETAVAGLIGTGDKIDVMVSYNSPEGVRAVRTVLRNVRVIGTDQPAGQSSTTLPRTITLELHPEGAKMLTLAKHTGDLILVLSDQNDDDMPVIANDAPMLSTQISGVPAQRAAPPPAPPSVSIIRGNSGRKDQIISAQEPITQNLPPAAAGTNP